MDEISVKRGTWDISVTVKSNGKQIIFFCKDVRGAVIWPSLESHGYYLILGQKTDSNIEGKCPLFLLSEGAEELPKDLFKRLVEDGRRFSCREFYSNMKKENWDLVSLFYDFCRYQRASNLKLTKAPFSEDLSTGMMLVKAWAKFLEIPKSSLLREELKVVQTEDMLERPERFPAIQALRFLIGSLEKDPWQAPSLFGTQRNTERRDAGGWT